MRLVKGYEIREPNTDGSNVLCTLWAVHDDGRVVKSDRHIYKSSDPFGSQDRTWTPVDAVPPQAEFIGNYPSWTVEPR